MGSKLKIFLGILLMFLGLVAIVLGVLTFLIFGDNTNSQTTTLKNPVIDLTDEQAIALFDEGFVIYLLYSIDAQNLNNIPLTSNTPKIQIEVDDKIYFAQIIKNSVQVTQTQIEKKDIVIKTTKLEAIKMLRDKNYVATSFKEGLSTIDLIASNTDLLLKGYLDLQKQFG
jgi:hypothetical protein